MDTAAILALIGDLYAQVNVLTQENASLREALQNKEASDG